MTAPGAGTPLTSTSARVALAYLAAMTATFAAVAVVIAVPVLIRGVSTYRVSLLVLATAMAACGTALLAVRVRFDSSDASAKALSAGIGAAGLTLMTLMVLNTVRAANGVGWADVTLLTVGILVTAAAIPFGRWLADQDRAEHALDTVLDRSAPWAPPTWTRVRSREIIVLLGMATVLAIGLIAIRSAGALGHDESIYALKARSWISDTPTTGWADYRPLGMSVVAWVVLQFSSTEAALRTAAIVLSVITIVTMWTVGRTMYDAVTATLASAVFAGTASFLRRATELLNDVSSAGLLLATMGVIWYQFERRPHSWWLLAAAPLAAGAYYMRYGSVLGLVVIAVVGAVLWNRTLLVAWRQILATGALLIACLVPHFVYSRELTGSVLGVFQSARTSVGGGGGGLADYLSWLPSRLAGPSERH